MILLVLHWMACAGPDGRVDARAVRPSAGLGVWSVRLVAGRIRPAPAPPDRRRIDDGDLSFSPLVGDGIESPASAASVLSHRCLACHAGPSSSSGIDLSGEVPAARRVMASRLADRERMPPAPASPLSPAEKAALRAWAVEGGDETERILAPMPGRRSP